MGKPLPGTIAEACLRKRRITAPLIDASLRFHPRCYYRDDDGTHSRGWPALLAAVTNADGATTGVHRTWLNPAGGEAPVATQRRALGSLLGNGVRFGRADDIAAIGEGLETVLSLRSVFPNLPMVAAFSARHRPLALNMLDSQKPASGASRDGMHLLVMQALCRELGLSE